MRLFREGAGDNAELLWVEPVDLVAALREEGGQVLSLWPGKPIDLKPGRYLVVRIDGEET